MTQSAFLFTYSASVALNIQVKLGFRTPRRRLRIPDSQILARSFRFRPGEVVALSEDLRVREMPFSSEKNHIYEFNGWTLNPASRLLTRNGAAVDLPPKAFDILVFFVKSEEQLLSKDEILNEVWPDSSVEEGNVAWNVSQLRKVLGDDRKTPSYIQTVSGYGYRFIAKVCVLEQESSVSSLATGVPQAQTPASGQTTPEELIESANEWWRIPLCSLGRHSIFIATSAVSYGLLFWIAVTLEIAYRFDLYAFQSLKVGPPLMIINTLALIGALVTARKQLSKGKRGGLFKGITLLVCGVMVSTWLTSMYLPNTPITLSNHQAQPAFAAFLKNAVLYFLPLSILFLLMPFYVVAAIELKAKKVISHLPIDAVFARPRSLALILGVAIIYSLVTTFYLVDHLQTGPYHGLFVSLVFIRFITYFGLGLGSLLWYKGALAWY
jgi:DNA-binding winged helix-turn-helix (wHTH) protein